MTTPDDQGNRPDNNDDGAPDYEASGRHWPLLVAFAVLALALLFAW